MKFLKFMVAAACVALLPSFTSCKDEPDNPDAPVMPENTPRLTGVGDIKYEYDAKGRMNKLYGTSAYPFSIMLDYEKGEVLCKEYGESLPYKAKFNSNGTFSELAYEIEEDWAILRGSYKFSYNKDANLVSIVVKEEDEHEGEYFKYEGEAKYTWENGCLTGVKFKMNEVDAEDYKEETTLSYSSTKNEFLQFPVGVGNLLFPRLDNIGYLAAAGLLGVGFKNLPSRMEVDVKGEDSYHNSLECDYELNDDGSIKSEDLTKRDGDYYDSWKANYYYDGAQAGESNKAPVFPRGTKRSLFSLSN